MSNSLTERIKRLQQHLSSQYVDFDLETTTDRLLSLYSDFSKLKILNHYGYNANVNYWRAVILDCNLQGYLSTQDHACFIDKTELPELFYRPKKGKPLSLNTVIDEMLLVSNDLITQREFEKKYPIKQHQGWFQWFYERWIYSEPPPTRLIVLPTIKEYAKIIHQKHYKKPLVSFLDNLFTFNEFKQAYGTISCYQETIIQLSDLDLWLILRYLHFHHGIDVQDNIIKFPNIHETEKEIAKINTNDRAIINLKIACTKLNDQINELQTKSEEFIDLAKDHLKNKRKPQAVYMFKKTKKIEDILDQRLKTLETMETILLKIEASQNDLQVIQAFNMGADTLRQLLNHKELKIDSIDKTMENIQESLSDQKEIEEAIMLGNQDISNQQVQISQEELEQELESLKPLPVTAAAPAVNLTQPINTDNELLRLQSVLASLNYNPNLPSHNNNNKVKELAS